MADTPETSAHTSIQERITPSFNLPSAIRNQQELGALNTFDLPLKPLLHFEGGVRDSEQTGILFSFDDYLQLVDYTGRCVRDDKKGAIPNYLPAILERLHIDRDTWLLNSRQFEGVYHKRFRRRYKQQRNAA